jgi:drug/metabolite transporter (DMT)-like permease
VQTLSASYTCFTVLLAVLFLRERMRFSQAIGIALVIAATLYLTWFDRFGHPSSHDAAPGWLAPTVIATLLWGVTGALLGYAYRLDKADHHRAMLANSAGLALTLLPFAALTSRQDAAAHPSDALGVAAVAMYVVADLTYYAAAAHGPMSIVTVLTGAYPLVSIVYAAVVLDQPTGGIWPAVGMMLPGVALVIPRERDPIVAGTSWLRSRMQRSLEHERPPS